MALTSQGRRLENPLPRRRAARCAPNRIQLSRKKGWRLPRAAVSVARPTMWGNPFRVGQYSDDQARCVKAYERCIRDWPVRRQLVDTWRKAGGDVSVLKLLASRDPTAVTQLRGRDLACWCPIGAPCHADVLLRWANRKR